MNRLNATINDKNDRESDKIMANSIANELDFLLDKYRNLPNGINLLVDRDYYYEQYADIKACGIDPATHYFKHGWKEGRNPNRWFNSQKYLEAYPDVKSQGICPLIHYVQVGAKCGYSAITERCSRQPREYSAEITKACTNVAAELNVLAEIHPEDMVFHFLLDSPKCNGIASVNYYFHDGYGSAQKFKEILERFAPNPTKRLDILEFASGYGCVSRHFANLGLPHKFHACDIHPAAMEFIERNLGLTCFLSNAVPENLNIQHDFDVIFALSFFSHMPPETWTRWLVQLSSLLKKQGIIIFTTHGLVTARTTNKDCARLMLDGTLFYNESEQKDLDITSYGNMFVTPSYVISRIAQLHGVEMIAFTEGVWWGHQDLYVLRKM